MDAQAQLALAAKAVLVFGQPGTFLSFPALTPLGWAPELLDFTTIATSAHMLAFSELCRLVNACPQRGLFQPATDRFLWDAYRDVLSAAVLAEGDLSADDQSTLQAARAVLYVAGPDGTPGPSAAVAAYTQCRAAWLAATQAYAAAKLAAGSGDAAAQAQWTQTDEPALRAAVDDAEQTWEGAGQKAAVEAARTAEAACAARAPAVQWENWQAQFNPDLDMLTDPASVRFAITGFTPAGFWQQTTWPTLTLNQAEIASLAAQAPAPLRGALGGGVSTVASISLDYCAVSLNRPWFHPEMFSARFWDLPGQVVSDGNDPPGGTWPAYVAAVVFVRNVKVTPVPAPAAPAAPAAPHPPVPIAHPPFVFHPMPVGHPAPPVVHPPAPVPFHPPMAAHPMVMAHPTVVAHPIVAAPQAMHPAVPPQPATHPAAVSATVPFRTFTVQRLMLPQAAVATQPAAKPPGTAPAPTSAASDPTVSILAFICTPLGKCPNPDPSFTWAAAAPAPSTP